MTASGVGAGIRVALVRVKNGGPVRGVEHCVGTRVAVGVPRFDACQIVPGPELFRCPGSSIAQKIHPQVVFARNDAGAEFRTSRFGNTPVWMLEETLISEGVA